MFSLIELQCEIKESIDSQIKDKQEQNPPNIKQKTKWSASARPKPVSPKTLKLAYL